MCGLAGWFSARKYEGAERLVRDIVESQIHRGPDFQAVEEVAIEGGQCILGHDRLSILDLSAEANQPIWDDLGEVGLVFNGEMYNYIEVREELQTKGYKFRTSSDTEVILYAYREWGTDAISRFNGMFALALIDRRQKQLWLVRDRFGVKPLFLYRGSQGLAFASSGRILAKHFGLKPNFHYVFKGVTTWNFDDDSGESPYDGIDMVRPGHMWVCEVEGDELKVRESCWYDIRDRVGQRMEEISGYSAKQTTEVVLETFENATMIRLRSDVPVAVALSGGLDSGAVACMSALRLGHHDVRAFCFGDGENATTEGPVAKRLADKAGIGISFIRPDQTAVANAFERTLEAQDAPFVSVSQVAQYLVSRQVREEGYTVLLGGQGGDEGYMGYRKYFLFALKNLAARKRWGEAAAVASSMVPMIWAERSQWGNYGRHKGRFGNEGYCGVFRFPSEWKKPSLLPASREPVWKRQMLDVTRFSLPTLLRYEDRNSMAHSVESRLPFLDYRMIELGLALPESQKVAKGYGKWALREAFNGLVPDEVRLARYKHGFPVDQARLIEAGLGATMRSWVKDARTFGKEFLQDGFEADRDFSNETLTGKVGAFPELVSLAWMLRRL